MTSDCRGLRERHGRAGATPHAVHGRAAAVDARRNCARFADHSSRAVAARRPVASLPLTFDDTVVMSPRPRSSGVRRARASTSGATHALSESTLTDERKRAFARRATRHGGIVVIDQSGSMDIDDASLRRSFVGRPTRSWSATATDPATTERRPTCGSWPTAVRSRRRSPRATSATASTATVLAWALRRRRGTEPIVWVTDGQVTDSHDHPDDRLTAQCAEMVRRHRIRLVKELGGAGRAPCRAGEQPSAPSGRSSGDWAGNSLELPAILVPFRHSRKLLLQRTLVRLTLYEQVFVKGVGHGGS